MATSLAVADSASRQQAISAIIPQRLDSWKEIAFFFARTIRTVQRWERTEKLPVYRHIHEKLGSVYAFESELLAWRDARSWQQAEGSLRKKASARRLRLAVLPFSNLSTDPQLRYFEDGLTYEIISQFARLVAQIGRSLNVDFILEGSVRLAGRQVRMAAQLIDVGDQTHLFADTCARRWAEGISIQVAFAERIAGLVCEHLLVSLPSTV